MSKTNGAKRMAAGDLERIAAAEMSDVDAFLRDLEPDPDPEPGDDEAKRIAARRPELADVYTPTLPSPATVASLARRGANGGGEVIGRVRGEAITCRKDMAAVMIAGGYRRVDVAATFGVTPRTVRNWLADPGVQERIEAERLAMSEVRATLRDAHRHAAHYLLSRLTPKRDGDVFSWTDTPALDRIALALIGRHNPWT